MPEHGHGMSTKPVLQVIDEKTVKVEGVKLSMRGQWRLDIVGACSGTKFKSETTLKL